MPETIPILQFGTSRFLQAHADLFISEGWEKGEALGGIAIVQTTASLESAARVAALANGGTYPVLIRGFRQGQKIDEQRRGKAIRKALQAERDWKEVRRLAVEEAQIILSNTGEKGYELSDLDDASLIQDFSRTPHSFPAKLAGLLLERWQVRPDALISLFPCELISRNGDKLRDIICSQAVEWGLPEAFIAYIREHCKWANSLVDRIVSEPIHPIGAVAEPYALWVIERQDGLVLPCQHEAIILTDRLDLYERLKLHILNLGHSFLAERWLAGSRDLGETVLMAMNNASLREELEAVWHEEVLPVFAAEGLAGEAETYVRDVRERFLNPYLAHRLSDIAQNHREKKLRRIGPVNASAGRLGLNLPLVRLRNALESSYEL